VPSRYNTFFVLYPVGILSEAIEIYGSLQEAQNVNSLLGYLEKAVLYLTYVPGMSIQLSAKAGVL